MAGFEVNRVLAEVILRGNCEVQSPEGGARLWQSAGLPHPEACAEKGVVVFLVEEALR